MLVSAAYTVCTNNDHTSTSNSWTLLSAVIKHQIDVNKSLQNWRDKPKVCDRLIKWPSQALMTEVDKIISFLPATLHQTSGCSLTLTIQMAGTNVRQSQSERASFLLPWPPCGDQWHTLSSWVYKSNGRVVYKYSGKINVFVSSEYTLDECGC